MSGTLMLWLKASSLIKSPSELIEGQRGVCLTRAGNEGCEGLFWRLGLYRFRVLGAWATK